MTAPTSQDRGCLHHKLWNILQSLPQFSGTRSDFCILGTPIVGRDLRKPLIIELSH